MAVTKHGRYLLMEKASIVRIGEEIISGQTIDTNAPYLARELLSVLYIACCPGMVG